MANHRDIDGYVNNQTKNTQGIAPLRKKNGSEIAKLELEKAGELNGQCTDVLVSNDQENSTETDTNTSNIANQSEVPFWNCQ